MDIGHHHSFLTKLGLAVLTCSAALALCRSSRDDPSSAAFVAGAYGAVVLLGFFLRRFERAVEGEDRRKTKAAVWALTMLLTAMFASRVATLMPSVAGSVVVYLVAAGTAGAGFWALFLINP
ncbi:hypothetical protein HU200_035805 [Digitaria exilis]|uniref:Uncharacterized protein n=1 Tax=Digitaria exilis TaxID=1010633 RepID=A0A835BR10_9POAL|nr:hypothetical protein HU200_035805 [Digitaria exilis]CAB3466986.1 unnamed protein product [Digitaria exilis]